jgi:crotonobetainyl-CoA:carnitine CoA-transferase CaiB-like acyl-CoA transferase
MSRFGITYICLDISFNNEAEHSNFFESLNGGKRNLVLDLKQKEHKEAVRKLVRSYDVVVEGNRPGVMARLGLGYEDLKLENPGLIYCSLSGYGATGPLAQ